MNKLFLIDDLSPLASKKEWQERLEMLQQMDQSLQIKLLIAEAREVLADKEVEEKQGRDKKN